jgi:3-methyladenine DNA glycosylase/8-oxoguanine DNA glycosylase
MKKLKVLKKRCEIDLEATPPFNFKYTVYKPSHFPTKLEYFDEDSERFYRTFRLSQEKLVGLKMIDLKKIKNKDGIMLDVYSNAALSQNDIKKLEEHVIYAYGLKEDISEFYKSVSGDKNIREPIKNLNGMRNSCFETLYEILNISSMLQNTTVKRSEQMMKAMLSNFGERVTYDGKEFYVFYTPKDILQSSEQKLRELKVGYRAKFLMEIAKYFAEKPNLDEMLKKISFDDAKNELMKIKGVGPYSANIALFAYLKHPNFINFDVWNRKIFSNFLFGKDDKPLDVISTECEKKWGKYKGYASLYIIEDLFVRNPKLQYWRNNGS